MAESGLQFQTQISAEGALTLSLVNVDFPDPKEDEVLVRVEASPINPSDLGLLFGPADMSSAEYSEVNGLPQVKAMVPEPMLRHIGARAGHALPAGNELFFCYGDDYWEDRAPENSLRRIAIDLF